MTTRRIEFGPGVEEDVDSAAQWYAAERLQLGLAFLDQVDHGVERVRDNSLQFPIVHDGIHRAMLRRLPYGIYFEVLADGVIRVIAELHLHRDPGIGADRG